MSTTTPEEHTAASNATVQEPTIEEAIEFSRINTPLKVVIGSSFVLRIAGACTAILLASYLRQVVDAGTDLIGILSALFYLTELTLAPVFGALSDLRGRRFILILGPLVGALTLPIYPLSAAVPIAAVGVLILAVARLLEGISTAAKVPSALGYLADATAGEGPKATALRGRVMGFYEISFLIGLVGGTVIGGALWQAVGSAGFFLVSLFYLIATAMLFFFVPETLPAEARKHAELTRAKIGDAAHPVRALLKSRLKAYAELLKEPALRSFVPAWLAINAVVGLFGNLIQPIMIRPKTGQISPFPDQILDGKFSSSDVGFMFGGFGLVFMVGIFLWSLTYGRIRKTDTMLAAIVGLFLVCAMLFMINNLGGENPGLMWMLLPLLAIGIFLVSGFTPVALAYLAEISGARVEHRGVVMGLYSVFLGIGQLVGSGGGGFFVKALGQGFNGLVIGTVLLAIVALVAVVWLRKGHGV